MIAALMRWRAELWCALWHRRPAMFARDANHRPLWECTKCGRTWPRSQPSRTTLVVRAHRVR